METAPGVESSSLAISAYFIFFCRPLLKGGLKALYDQAQLQLEQAKTPEERDFILAMTKSAKFALRAKK